MAYITHAEAQYALSATSFVTIFDQDNDGIVDTAVVDAYIARASAHTDAWIAPVYKGTYPIVQTPVPAMVRECTLQYFLAYAYERRPDYTRMLQQGGADNDQERWNRADKMGERLRNAVLRIVELEAPSNVGGQVRGYGQALADGDTLRMFDDMGEFNR